MDTNNRSVRDEVGTEDVFSNLSAFAARSGRSATVGTESSNDPSNFCALNFNQFTSSGRNWRGLCGSDVNRGGWNRSLHVEHIIRGFAGWIDALFSGGNHRDSNDRGNSIVHGSSHGQLANTGSGSCERNSGRSTKTDKTIRELVFAALCVLVLAGTPSRTGAQEIAKTTLSITVTAPVVLLTWQESATAGVTQYDLYRGNSSSGPFVLLVSLNALDYTDASILPGQSYFYIVTAVLNGIESTDSNIAETGVIP